MNPELARTRGGSFGPMLVGGFGAAVAAASVWFVTHLPGLGLMEQVAIPLILIAWFLALAGVASNVRKGRALGVGIGGGVVSGVVGLIFVGAQLHEPGDRSASNLAIAMLGVVGLGVVMGAVSGLVGRVIARETTIDQPATHWLARFALVTALAVLPLIVSGGLVTSTNSGMAFLDWPQSSGVLMFLYPLRGEPDAKKLLEHSHRLFGSLVGFSTLVLLLFTLMAESRRWVKILAGVAFGLVCVQGLLGGVRVVEDSRVTAVVHGVLAQLTFGTIVGLATVLGDRFRAIMPSQILIEPGPAKRAKFFATGTLHSTILQLLFGATYRHFGVAHALLAHIGFSVVVTIMAMLAGAFLMHPAVRKTIVARPICTIGMWLAIAACVQFLLGWVALLARSGHADARHVEQSVSLGAAVLRTAHQANGAFLLALATMAFAWGKRLGRAVRETPAGAGAA